MDCFDMSDLRSRGAEDDATGDSPGLRGLEYNDGPSVYRQEVSDLLVLLSGGTHHD